MKKTNIIRQNVFPILAALIWGMAFVAQSVSADHIEAFTFNTSRAVIGSVVLLIACVIFDKAEYKKTGIKAVTDRKALIPGGFCCGLFLTAASYLQQLGLSETSPGKAGFITALYVVLVPVFGIFLKKKAAPQVWLGAALAVLGLYLLCIKSGFSIEPSDIYVFLCAIIFALHILCIDYFVQKVDGVKLSCAQFIVTALLSGLGMFIFEDPNWSSIVICLPQLLYVGVLSSGVAYTLQILAQKDSDPTVVTILLSLESVFSVLAGAVLLGDRLSGREYLGCVFMFAAVILAQLPMKIKK